MFLKMTEKSETFAAKMYFKCEKDLDNKSETN